jgi:DTW domain-containing protein YfiP
MTDDDTLESMWTQLCVETTADRPDAHDADEETRARRVRCETCGRPSVACPCAHLPAEPAQTRGALIVLTHPNERKRALATGWILPECFRRCAVVTKREPPRELTKMFADEDETSDEGVASDDSSANIRVSSPSPSDSEGPVVPNDVPVYVLYPASNAQDLDEVDPVADREALRREAERSTKKKPSIRLSPPRREGTFAARRTPPSRAAVRELANARDALRGAAYVLIALDSTWRQAREMAAAAMPALPRKTKLVKLPATKADAPGLRSSVFRVHDDDEEKNSPSTVLRVEPELGCMLTAEACARAVEKLERRFSFASGTPPGDSSSEPPPSPASAAVATIRAMARVQSAHDPAMRAGATKADAAGKRRQRIAAARNLVVSGGT